MVEGVTGQEGKKFGEGREPEGVSGVEEIHPLILHLSARDPSLLTLHNYCSSYLLKVSGLCHDLCYLGTAFMVRKIDHVYFQVILNFLLLPGPSPINFPPACD
ncbi:hypothetical protein RRG08_046771 [Elysia crispata]|uniref:Uncharacterized protein n=1 Tax=Elysia crispata TaxID=231223 RepID=A0AAE0ZV43_9GAST|nr:hypothetical protein RRG08_046771 [Elysia crispata]